MSERLLLVGWDAADWKILHPLMDEGKMPTLNGIVEGGASGTLLGSQPLVSAALWTSLVTGKRPWQHRVCLQHELDIAGQRPVPISSARRKAKTLWEMLADKGRKSLVVGWAATHGARSEHVSLVSNRYAEPTAGPGIKPWPAAIPGTYWPQALGANLDGVRVSPEDIQADIISQFVKGWEKVDQKRDRRIGHLRVFLAGNFSHHAAIKRLLSNDNWDFAAVNYPALGAISSLFLPYTAPKRAWVSDEDFGHYQHVLNAACLLCDRLLQDLIQAAGPQTAVVVASVHGVNPNPPPQYLRAGDNEVWRSPYGIFAARGSGFSRDSLVLGASVHDLAPTILTWFGLPMGDDMEGRVLIESFAATPAISRIPSWEPGEKTSPDQTHTIHDPPPQAPTAEAYSQQYDWNLARSYLDGARYEEALRVLEKLFRAFPEKTEFGLALFHCQLTAKRLIPAAETLEVVLDGIVPGIWSLLPQVELLIAQGKTREARSLAEQIRNLKPSHPEALRRLGMIWWRLREWKMLADLAREVLRQDENESLAWLGLAEATLRQRQPSQAAEAAQRAIGLNYFLPQAHLTLARALLALGKWDEARQAMQTVIRLQPNNRSAATYSRRRGLGQDRDS